MKYAVTVDVGATHIRVALCSFSGKIIKKIKDITPTSQKKDVVIQKILSMIGELPKKDVVGIGIAAAGIIDHKKCIIVNPPNIPYGDISFSSLKILKKPLFLLNDATAGVIGEKHFGAGKNVDNLVYITISSGIGSGAYVDGKLLSGMNGNAGEVGHMVVDTEYNLPCLCSSGSGHWDRYCSGNSMPFFFKQWLKRHKKKSSLKSAKEIYDAFRKGDSVAKKFLNAITILNARGVSNVIVAYNPSLITIGGSVALHNKKDILSLTKHVDTLLKKPPIKITSLGEDIILYGALAAVIKKLGACL